MTEAKFEEDLEPLEAIKLEKDNHEVAPEYRSS